MTYLITQTFVLLLIAALLGMVLGWYLTRISAASARASLQSRLRSAETDARQLRGELDSAVTARGQAEAERKALADELATARSAADRVATLESDLAECRAAAADSAELDALQAELDDCRTSLQALTAPAVGNDREVDGGAIASAAAAAFAASGSAVLLADAAAPGLANPDPDDDGDDDLQQIKGIGPKIAGLLGELGVRRFAQIAAWTPENIEWVNEHLKFKGRVEREEWIAQAQALLQARDAE